jgi:hypothetical protein
VTDQDNSGLPPSPWLRRLRTVGGVRRELCRVYGEARDGTLDPQDATRLTHVLVAITRLIEGSELEQQIADLRTRLDEMDAERQRRGGRPNGHGRSELRQ